MFPKNTWYVACTPQDIDDKPLGRKICGERIVFYRGEEGREVWLVRAQPKIHQYYERALDGFSTNDLTHTLHYRLKLLENMQRLDGDAAPQVPDGEE